MSLSSIKSSIERIQREISSLNQSLSNEAKRESDVTERIFRAKQSISNSSNQSTIQSKLREISNLERDIVSIQKKKSDLTKKISDKTSELHKYQRQFNDEQVKEQKKLLDSIKHSENEFKLRQSTFFNKIGYNSILTNDVAQERREEYDAFICHASEDKDEFVRPLAEKLIAENIKVWYDEFQLKIGDSLRRSIDKGLANSRFGIVVLSPSFFAKNWPQYELDGLVTKEINSGKTILPIWHKVSKNEVIGFSPSLADKVALNTVIYTIDEILGQLSTVLKGT